MALEFPEHEKLEGLKGRNNVVGQFLDWLEEEGIILAKWDDESCKLWPHHEPIPSIIGRHFRVDLDKLEEEKQMMLKELRGC